MSLQFQDRPPARGRWGETVRELDENPGMWAEVADEARYESAESIKQHLRRYYGLSTRIRHVDGSHRVFACREHS